MTQEIEIKVADGVQVMRFTRADKKNAFTGPMYNAMSEALDAAEKNDAIAVHVFIGSGGVFSAGNDINDFMRRAQATAARRRQGHPGAVARLHPPPAQGDEADDRRRRRPRHRRRHHHAAALRPGLRHARRPACARRSSTSAWSRRRAPASPRPARMGYPRAFELICLGEPFSAERALQAGLVNAIVPADKLEDTALKAARRLAAKPRQALMTSRRLLRRNHPQISAMIEEEAQAYTGLMRSPEAREAFTAFLEKRPPDFAKARKAG